MKLKKVFCIMLCIALCACLLTGCGTSKHKIKVENADGTTTIIKYESSRGFSRTPVFNKSGNGVVMSFNGTEWYAAEVIDADYAAKYEGCEVLGESSNFKAYENLDNGFNYVYLMPLKDTDSAYIMFSNDEIECMSYAGDFGYCIQYFVDNTETVPDTDGYQVIEQPIPSA